jgi:thiol:disulfide interchange protein DsbD
VDLTRSGEREKSIKKHFNIRGVPTIIFIDGTGVEITDDRITGFVGPEEIRRRLERLIGDK